MSKKLPISLVIPSYNRSAQLELTLPLYLSLPVSEVILVDDHSDDQTQEKYSEFEHPKFKYVRNEENLKQPGARNKGIAMAQYDFILMGEDDVYMDEDYVKALYSKLEQQNGDFIAGRLINMLRGETLDEAKERAKSLNNKKFKIKNSLTMDYSCYFEKIIETPYLHACSLFRKKWAIDFPYCRRYKGNALREESHFYMNAYKNGAKILFYSKVSCFHMFHDYSGGCRVNHLQYFWSGLVNTKIFLDSFWIDLKKEFNIQTAKSVYMIFFTFSLGKDTFKHWLSFYFPGIHTFLKKLVKR